MASSAEATKAELDEKRKKDLIDQASQDRKKLREDRQKKKREEDVAKEEAKAQAKVEAKERAEAKERERKEQEDAYLRSLSEKSSAQEKAKDKDGAQEQNDPDALAAAESASPTPAAAVAAASAVANADEKSPAQKAVSIEEEINLDFSPAIKASNNAATATPSAEARAPEVLPPVPAMFPIQPSASLSSPASVPSISDAAAFAPAPASGSQLQEGQPLGTGEQQVEEQDADYAQLGPGQTEGDGQAEEQQAEGDRQAEEQQVEGDGQPEEYQAEGDGQAEEQQAEGDGQAEEYQAEGDGQPLGDPSEGHPQAELQQHPEDSLTGPAEAPPTEIAQRTAAVPGATREDPKKPAASKLDDKKENREKAAREKEEELINKFGNDRNDASSRANTAVGSGITESGAAVIQLAVSAAARQAGPPAVGSAITEQETAPASRSGSVLPVSQPETLKSSTQLRLAPAAADQTKVTSTSLVPHGQFPCPYNEGWEITRRSVQANQQSARPELGVPAPLFNIQSQIFPTTLIAQLLALHACVTNTELGKRIAAASHVKFSETIDDGNPNMHANALGVEYAIHLFITNPPAPNATIALAAKMGEVISRFKATGNEKSNEFAQGLIILCSLDFGASNSPVKNIFKCELLAIVQGDSPYERQLKLIDDYLIEKFYQIFYKFACVAEKGSDKPSSIVQNTFRYIMRDILRLAQKSRADIATAINQLNLMRGNNSATILDLLLNIIRDHTVKVGILPAFYEGGAIGSALNEVFGFIYRVYPSNIRPRDLNELLVKRPVLVPRTEGPATPASQLEILRTNILRITDYYCNNHLGREVIDDIECAEGEAQRYNDPDPKEIAHLRKLAGYAVQTAYDKRPVANILAELHRKMLETVKELRPSAVFRTKNSSLANTLAKLAGVNADDLINDPKFADAYKYETKNLLPPGIVLDKFTIGETTHYLRLHIIQYAGQLAADYMTTVNQSGSDHVIKEKYLKRIENRLETLYRMTPAEINAELEKLKITRDTAVERIIAKYDMVLRYLNSLSREEVKTQATIKRLTAEREKIKIYREELARKSIDFRDLVHHKLLGDMHPRSDINEGFRHGAFRDFIVSFEHYLYGRTNINFSVIGKLPQLTHEMAYQEEVDKSPNANTQNASLVDEESMRRTYVSLQRGGYRLDRIENMAKVLSVINWYCNSELGRQIAEQNGIVLNLNCTREIRSALMSLAHVIVKIYLGNDQNLQLKEDIKKTIKAILKVAVDPAEYSIVCTLLLLADVNFKNESYLKSFLGEIDKRKLVVIPLQRQLPDNIINNIDTQTPSLCEELIVRHIIGQIDLYLSVFNTAQFGKPTRLQEFQVYRLQKKLSRLQKPVIGNDQANNYQGPALTKNIFTWLRSLLPVAGMLPELCQKAALAELLMSIYLLATPNADNDRGKRTRDLELTLISGSPVIKDSEVAFTNELLKKFEILTNLLRVINYAFNTAEGKKIAEEAPCAINDDFRWNDRLKRLMIFAFKTFLTPPAENTDAQHKLINDRLIREIEVVANEIYEARGGHNVPVAHTLGAMVNSYYRVHRLNWVTFSVHNMLQANLAFNYTQNYIEQQIIQGAIRTLSIFDNEKPSNITEIHRKGIRKIMNEWNRFFLMSVEDRGYLIRNVKNERGEGNIYTLLWEPILNLIRHPLMGKNSIFITGSVLPALNATFDYLEQIKPGKPSPTAPLVVQSIDDSRKSAALSPSGTPQM